MIRRALLSTVIVATALPGRAFAEPELAPPPAPPLTWAAGELVELGLAAHARGDYPAALTAFELAAALAPHPLLDFDRAQTLRLAGRDAEALVAYRTFLAAESTGPEADLARGFVATLTERVDRDRDREPEDPPPPDPPTTTATPRRGGRALRVVGMTSATLGVGALGAATYLALSARAAERTLSTPGATYDPALDARGRRDARWATITALAGGALVVTGAGLYLAGHRRGAVVLAPSATREQVALVVTGSWR